MTGARSCHSTRNCRASRIVLAYSDQMRVEHYSRTPDGWRLDVLTRPEESLALDKVEFAIEVRQVDFDLPL
jgi:hypothetical protein